jgi:hypothetical protein
MIKITDYLKPEIEMLKTCFTRKIDMVYYVESMVRLGDISEAEAGYIFNQL